MPKSPKKAAAKPVKTAVKAPVKAATKKTARKTSSGAAKRPAARSAAPMTQLQFDALMATPLGSLTPQDLLDMGLVNTEPNKNVPPGPGLVSNSVLSDADVQRIAIALQALLAPN